MARLSALSSSSDDEDDNELSDESLWAPFLILRGGFLSGKGCGAFGTLLSEPSTRASLRLGAGSSGDEERLLLSSQSSVEEELELLLLLSPLPALSFLACSQDSVSTGMGSLGTRGGIFLGTVDVAGDVVETLALTGDVEGEALDAVVLAVTGTASRGEIRVVTVAPAGCVVVWLSGRPLGTACVGGGGRVLRTRGFWPARRLFTGIPCDILWERVSMGAWRLPVSIMCAWRCRCLSLEYCLLSVEISSVIRLGSKVLGAVTWALP